METVEIVNMILSIIFAALFLAAAFYSFYALYYAYFKRKDEREKLIVLRSTAHAFSILLVYFFLDSVVLMAQNESLTRLWNLVRGNGNIEMMTVAGMTTVFGVCLFINKRRLGAKDEK